METKHQVTLAKCCVGQSGFKAWQEKLTLSLQTPGCLHFTVSTIRAVGFTMCDLKSNTCLAAPSARVSACFHLCNRWASLTWLGEQRGTNAPRPSALHFAKANVPRTASWWLSQRQSRCFEQAPRVSVGSRTLVCPLFVRSEEAAEPLQTSGFVMLRGPRAFGGRQPGGQLRGVRENS